MATPSISVNNCAYKFWVSVSCYRNVYKRTRKIVDFVSKRFFSVHLAIIEKPNFLSKLNQCWNRNTK